MAAQVCLGWGQTGHRTIGEVASTHLSRKAEKQVKKLLGAESLAIASTWMDEVRSDSTFDYAKDWHWVTIPEGTTYAQTEKNPNGDLIEAIGRMKTILSSDTASRESKVVALKFLVHLVGDLHQPLHVGNGTDKGGNDVKVKYFWESSNLHRVWDSGIIDGKGLSYTELAKAINHTEKDQVKAWQSGTVVEWAQEAQKLHKQVYDFRDVGMLSYEYDYRNWDTVQNQLLKGGVRLAGILNEVFD
jgi:hypothetical protein